MYNLGVAVAGTGFIGPVHVEALQRIGINVVGILGSSEKKSYNAAETLGLKKAYKNFQEILEDNSVQAVHITVPNYLHYEMARNAINAGKHVLCEKPLAMNSRESANLVEMAKKTKGVVAGVCYNVRFYPLNLEARDMVKRGYLGDVYFIYGSYVQDWLFHRTDYNWRLLSEKGGDLRAVADIGTHWLDLIYSITGLEVEAVFADLKTVYPVRLQPKGEIKTFKGKEEKAIETEDVRVSTEDYACVMFRFKGGAHGCLWVSQITAGRKNCLRYEMTGSNCALSWCSEQPNDLWIGHRDKPNEWLTRDPALLSDTAKSFTNYPGGHNEGFPDTFKQCFRAFYDYITAGNFSAPAPFPTFKDGHREILLCEAILKSYKEERWVKM